MSVSKSTYKRLTRERGSGVLGNIGITRSSLWLGEDHLLLVECSGYSENYKRFFFRDIQAVTIRKTKARMVWNWIWGALLALSGLIIWASSYDSTAPDAFFAAMVAAAIMLAIFGIPLLLNNLFGPTCTAEIRTAVQTESLPSLARVRKTKKIMSRIRPLIIAAQGQLSTEEVTARIREAAVAPAALTAWSGNLPPVIS